jgi:diguanylate cyclase (GGDEF)-like protein
MNQASVQLETSTVYWLQWPTWLAAGGIVIFCLLGLYAGLLVFADQRFAVRYRLPLPASLRVRIMLGVVMAATIPAVSLALVLTERAVNEQIDHTAELMKSQTASFAKLADYFLLQSEAKLTASATVIDIENRSDTRDVINQTHRTSPEFLSIMLIDNDGRVIATTEFGEKNITELSVDTDYVQMALQTKASRLSGIKPHPGDDATPTAAISVPVSNHSGRITGLLIGFLRLDSFERLNKHFLARYNFTSIMTDASGTALYAGESAVSETGHNQPIESLFKEPYIDDGKLFEFSQAKSDEGPPRRHLATGYTLRDGWRVYLVRPLESIEMAMLGEYGIAFAWLGGILIISICLALAMVSGISGPLESLDRSVRDFDLRKPRTRPDPPPSAPQEVRSIFEHLGDLDKRVRTAYRKLHKAMVQGERLRGELIYVISNREKEIEARTEELKEANETLERLSREDSLTGLANRRWFAQFLAQTWRTALRDNKAISILIMDIDDFKAYNDTYGHQKGDECLKLVAQAIHRSFGRASDLVSRYGGEEFVVILGDTPLEGALQIAEQIRAAVEALQIPHSASKYHQFVTLSIGVTSTLPTHDTQPETVLISADRAMYNAKHNGKNRVAYSTAARTGTYQKLVVTDGAPTRLS